MKRNPLTLIIGAVLLVIFSMLLFVFQVRQSEVALITTFGKPTRTITVPGGPYFKLPWPIQRVHKFDQRVQNFEDKDSLDEAYTADHSTLLCKVYVGWKITDPGAFFPKFASSAISDPEQASIASAQEKLEAALRTAKSAVVGNHVLADFISTDAAQNKFDAIENEILAIVQNQVKANNYGIEIEFLGIKKLGFPESVTQTVFTQMTKERQKRISAIQYPGEARASNIRTEADRESAQMLADADAQAALIRGEGQKEAAQYFKVFEMAPQLEIFLLKLNALEPSLKNRATLILDDHTPPFDLFRGQSTNLPPKP